MHTCTSGCGKDLYCPICPHGKDSETFCNECDKPASEPWEIEFDEKFCKLRGDGYMEMKNHHAPDIKSFIRIQREQARREERAKILQAYRQCTGIQDDVFTKSLE